MNLRSIQMVAAAFMLVGVFGFSAHESVGTLAGNAAKTRLKVKELQITFPSDPDSYGVGTYTIEGFVAKKQKVNLLLDGKVVDSMTANVSDGTYFSEIAIEDAGNHKFTLEEAGEGKKVIAELQFNANKERVTESSSKPKAAIMDEASKEATDSGDYEPIGLLPDDTGDDVVYKNSENDAIVDKVDPNAPAKSHDTKPGVDPNKKPTVAKAGVAKAKAPVKPNAKKPMVDAHGKPIKKPVAKKPGKVPFGISSHANFNVVPHGLVKFGGKGKPGDRIMLLIDGKPAVRGSVKANGRWQIPVKVSKPGFRKITVQNLKTREAKTIKLKIK